MIETHEISVMMKAVATVVREYVEAGMLTVRSEIKAIDQRINNIPTGSTLLVSKGPPLSPGNTGDIYLDSETGNIYRCT